jgi:predicted phosphodiesterase
VELRSENVMVISDLHYPYCDVDEVRRVVKEESPETVILLGDAVEEVKGFHDFKSSLGNVVHVNGDEDVIKGDDDVITLFNGGKKFTMLHGHQLMNEEGEKWLAKILMKVNREIPPFLFCLGFRVKMSGFLVLGHSHAMSYFPSLQCVNAGTMSLKRNLYNDRGYLLIRRGKVNMKRI